MDITMNSDQLNGGLDQAVGRAKGAAGALVDDAATQVKGKVQAATGKAKSLYGDARSTLDDAGAQVKDKLQVATGKAQNLIEDTRDTLETQVTDKPLAAMAAIGAVGLAAGLLLGGARRLGRKDRR
jgi:uncharacterized protein YjbJ (UPF0337 family)